MRLADGVHRCSLRVAKWPIVLISLPIVLALLAFGRPAERAFQRFSTKPLNPSNVPDLDKAAPSPPRWPSLNRNCDWIVKGSRFASPCFVTQRSKSYARTQITVGMREVWQKRKLWRSESKKKEKLLGRPLVQSSLGSKAVSTSSIIVILFWRFMMDVKDLLVTALENLSGLLLKHSGACSTLGA